MNRGLVALSSAAILSVYGVGYVLSQPPASIAAGPEEGAPGAGPSPTAVATRPASTSPTAVAAARTAATATASSAPASAAPASTLKDGTYTGSGSSRHGGVNVSVVVKNGRIASAAITSVTTRYSQNVIAGLPAQVVNAQGASVNLVSGATDSSNAYVQAVRQALSKASGASAGTTYGVEVTGPQGTIYSGGSRNG